MPNQPTLPFLYGAQYYRAPTPDPACWAADLAQMKRLGFNAVKFWVQWRWSERREGEYCWDDLDQLMDLAAANGLQVTLNLILEVAPNWMYRDYPDSVMIDAEGRRLDSVANICRQIGGYPGPCHHHPAMRDARQRFVAACVNHFKTHPALQMWDVWNEPESNLMRREPHLATLLCYCPTCLAGFQRYVERKYRTIAALNAVWGRCYSTFDEVEAPRDAATVSDFIDWREFQLDKLTADAAWRLRLVKELDPGHLVYLHVVANAVNCFNFVTCVDDFALAEHCDVFASTISQDTLLSAQAISAAQGRVFYNAEWHLNFGSTALHQRVIDRDTFLNEALPQIGWGVRGFLYWQYRAETLGIEAPAWGLIRPDGSPRPVCAHAAEWIAKLTPHLPALMRAKTAAPRIGLWRSRRNEIFHFCMDGNLNALRRSVAAYAEALYRLNLPFRILDSAELTRDGADLPALLVLPSAYFLDETEAAALDAFVQRGGVILAEGHLGGYNGTAGRHSSRVPGCGLAAAWGLEEAESTAAFHLPRLDATAAGTTGPEVAGDVRKALLGSGVTGGEFFPIVAPNGVSGCGALRFAALAGDDLTAEGYFNGTLCVASRPVGAGTVFYAGTLLGCGPEGSHAFFEALLVKAAARAGVRPVATAPECHVDRLLEEGHDRFVVLINRGAAREVVLPAADGEWQGVFYGGAATGGRFPIDAGQAELFALRA